MIGCMHSSGYPTTGGNEDHDRQGAVNRFPRRYYILHASDVEMTRGTFGSALSNEQRAMHAVEREGSLLVQPHLYVG
jgi:hypothetical protein